MKFLTYSIENDKITTDEIIYYIEKIKASDFNNSYLSEDIVLLLEMYEMYYNGYFLKTPYHFSRISKKEFFIAKCKFLHLLKYSRLSEITNQDWYKLNEELLRRRWYEENNNIYSEAVTLEELYDELWQRTELLELRKKQQRKIKRIAKKDRTPPSLSRLLSAKINANKSVDMRIDKANELSNTIYDKACELLENGTAKHNVASILANKYFHLSERQIRRHLTCHYFITRKRKNKKSTKDKAKIQSTR